MAKYFRIMAASLFFMILSCDNSTGIVPPVLPHNPVDQGWKAVENLEYAFDQRDSELLDETLDPTFLILLPEEEWDDYNGDGIMDTTLTRGLYLSGVIDLFQEYESVELDLQGSDEEYWQGDPSGETMQYPRVYLMEVSQGTQDGWTISGDAILRCRPDSSGTWRVTWIEYSQDE